MYRCRLRKEHLADLSVASDDYFAAEEADIVQIEATLAMVGGHWCNATPRGNERQPTGWHRADKTARQRIRLWLRVVRLASISPRLRLPTKPTTRKRRTTLPALASQTAARDIPVGFGHR